MDTKFVLQGNIVDVFEKKIFKGELKVENGIISEITKKNVESENIIVPGLIDSHVHIESSMLPPSEFGRIAVQHGTVAVVSDPHEIANVLGAEGVEFMLDNAKQTSLKIFFGAPSCVPSTGFETSGSELKDNDVNNLLERGDIFFLSEMMNYPGVVFKDDKVLKKIHAAKLIGKPIDGHAPGLTGDDLKAYIDSGISTDHECFAYEEAVEKLNLGMKIQIREGSAAKNLNALHKLIDEYPDKVMLCTDDSHPDDLLSGHIDRIIRKALNKNVGFINLIAACTKIPVEHYKLPVGLLRVGDRADISVFESIEDFKAIKTIIDGKIVYENGTKLRPHINAKPVNVFNSRQISIQEISVIRKGNSKIKVIDAIDGELVTKKLLWKPNPVFKEVLPSVEEDVLKIIVKNRYKDLPAVVGFIRGFGLKNGAIASTIAHDSHNIISIGTNDKDIVLAVNEIIDNKGGISVSIEENCEILPLPVAGIISNEPVEDVAEKYLHLSRKVKELGSTLNSPFMTLSFMALLVIPEIKIGDLGLFESENFSLTSLFE